MTGIPHQPTKFDSISPPGQSLVGTSQMRQQQLCMQQQDMQPQMAGYQMPQAIGGNPFQPQPTGFDPTQKFGRVTRPSPFSGAISMQSQPTDFQGQPTCFQVPQPTGFFRRRVRGLLDFVARRSFRYQSMTSKLASYFTTPKAATYVWRYI